MPLILSLPKNYRCNRPIQRSVFLVAVIMKDNSNLMRSVVISIDQHDCPLPVWPLQCVGGNEHVSIGVLDIAGCAEQPVLGIPRLRPLLSDPLCSEELRRSLLYSIVVIHTKHVLP